MVDASEELVRIAEELYHSKLKSELEPDHVDEFIVIEPVSGDYFLGKTLTDAAAKARRVHPHRQTHAMCVGHATALHFGMYVR